MDVTPFLDRKADTPLYQQLIRYFKTNMHEGKLRKNTKLPSKRQLIEKLQISQTTVEHAYGQLLAEGYIISKPKSGYIVQYDFTKKLQYKGNETSVIRQGAHTERIQYDFNYGHVDKEYFPWTAWRKSVNISWDHTSELCQPGDDFGELELRSLISDYLYQSRGVHSGAEQIIIGGSTSYLLQLICMMMPPFQHVGFEDPGYPRSRELFKVNEKKVIPIPVDSEGIIVKDLYNMEPPEFIYVTPSFHYPLGNIMTINRRLELLKWASEHQTYIIEDDYEGEFRYRGRPIQSLQALDHAQRVLYVGTFSKLLLPTLRVSYMVIPKHLITKAKEIFSIYKQTVPSSVQFTLADFIKRGELQKHLNKMRKIYHTKKTLVLKEINQHFLDSVTIHGENSGPRILLTLNINLTEAQLIEKASEACVKVYPVSNAYMNKVNSQTVSLGFSGLSENEIVQGIRLLKEAWVK